MSTVIDNFFIIKTKKMADIDMHNRMIEEITNKLSKETIYKTIIDDFLLFENEKFIKNVFAKKYATYQNKLLFQLINEKYAENKFELHEFYYDVINLAAKIQSNCELNKMTNIYFKTKGNKTFYRIYNTSNYKEIIENIKTRVPLISYDYYDNADLPEDINKREWKKRGKEYNELFRNSNSYEDVMNVKICKPSNNLYYRDNEAFKRVIDDYYKGDFSIIERLKDKEFSYWIFLIIVI